MLDYIPSIVYIRIPIIDWYQKGSMSCSWPGEEELFFDNLVPKERGVVKVWLSLQPKWMIESSM